MGFFGKCSRGSGAVREAGRHYKYFIVIIALASVWACTPVGKNAPAGKKAATGALAPCSLSIPSPAIVGSALDISWIAQGQPTAVKISLGATTVAEDLSAAGRIRVTAPAYPALYNYTLTFSDASGPTACTASVAVVQSGLRHPLAQVWPQLYAEAGSYGVQNPTTALIQSAVAYLAQKGFRLNLMWAGFQPTLKENGAAYIDATIQSRIYRACGFPAIRNCSLSAADRTALLASIQAYLDAEKNDAQNVAYWVLDDAPGDIRSLLETVHQMVAEANKTSVVARPTICGIGANLDMLPLASTATSDRYSYLNTAVAGFTPKGCDAVALYSYAQHVMPYPDTGVDWPMQWLLPYTVSALKAKGWDPAKQPMLGMPQAFYYSQKQTSGQNAYVGVSRRSVALQMASYCAAGASGILFYAWYDSKGGESGTREPWNTPEIEGGLDDGLAACRQIWENGGTPPADQQRKLDLARLQSALEAYYLVYHTYSVAEAGWNKGGNGWVNMEGSVDYPLAIAHALANQKFLSVPAVRDPGKASDYLLNVCNGGQKYSLYATLDRPLATDLSNAESGCGGTGPNGATTAYGKNYAVSGGP